MTIDRRRLLEFALGLAVAPIGAMTALAQSPAVSRTTAYAFSFRDLNGSDFRLVQHAGKPILIVNTASLCGYVRQFSGLESLWTRYRERGLLVLGVPSNDFGAQEPGSAADIRHTAHAHGVTFPLMSKVDVKGETAHPFYRWAALQRPLDTPRWNFHKYLVGRDGMIAGAFGSAIDPLDPKLVAAIERELAGGQPGGSTKWPSGHG
jgi:glutathione peroxidase